MKRYLIFISFCALSLFGSISVCAQEDNVTPVNINLIPQFGEQKNLISGGCIYINEKTPVTFTFSIACDTVFAKNVENGKYVLSVTKDGSEPEELVTDMKAHIQKEDSTSWELSFPYSMSDAGKYTVSGEAVFYHVQNESDTISIDTISCNSIYLEVLKPVVSATACEAYYVIQGDNVELEPFVTGGYGTDSDWAFTWKDGESGKKRLVSADKVGVINYELTATNYIGTAVWEEVVIPFEVNICEVPVLDLTYSNKSMLLEKNINGENYVEPGEYVFELSINYDQENLKNTMSGSMYLYDANSSWAGPFIAVSGFKYTGLYKLAKGDNRIYGKASLKLTRTRRIGINENHEFETLTEVVKEMEISSNMLTFQGVDRINVALDKNDYHVILNDPMAITADIDGGFGNISDWTFIWDSIEGDKTSVFTSSTIGDAQHTLKAINTINGIEWDSEIVSFIIHTYDTPKISLEGATDTTICYPHKPSLTLHSSGGYRSSWTYEWQKDGVKLDNTTPTLSYDENDGEKDIEYKVTAKNTYDSGNKEWSETHLITIHQFAQPKVISEKVPQGEKYLFVGDVYNFKDSLQYGVQYEGGNKNGWVIKVYNETENEELTSQQTKAQDDPVTYKMTITNRFIHPSGKETIWFDNSYRLSIVGLKAANISEIIVDSIDIYANNPVKLSLTYEGGLPDRWTFLWRDVSPENNVVSKFVSFNELPEWIYQYNKNLTGDDYLERDIEVLGVCWTDGRRDSLYKTTKLRIWPTIDYNDDVEHASHVREGNSVNLSIQRPHGGFGNGWGYAWHESGDSRTLSKEQSMTVRPSIEFTSSEQEKKDISYVVDVTNYGPLGNIWGARRYDNILLTVYHRPQTPQKLKRKGNGASMTMIVDNTDWMSGTILANRKYKFWFGYTNDQGVDVPLGEPASELYFKFANDNQYWQEKQYWVCAVWDYDDGARITSGKCYMLGGRDIMEGTSVDESFDKSDFSRVTRSEGQMSAVDGPYLSEEPTTVYIYQSDGKFVKKVQTDNDGRVDTNGLKQGVYVLRYMQGDNVSIRKIVVK